MSDKTDQQHLIQSRKKTLTHINVGLKECTILCQTVQRGGLTLRALKGCFNWQRPLVRISHFWMCVAFCWRHHTVAYCLRVSRHLSCRLSGGTRCWEKISFTLNFSLLYFVITTFSWPLVVGSRIGVSLKTYHFQLWSRLDNIAVKGAQVRSCQSIGPRLLTRCNVALTKG